VTRIATVAELGADGTLTVLAKTTNEWVCVPGNENKIGEPPMCMNPMGMRWMMDAMQGKPKPTNESPGMIYMLCGATQQCDQINDAWHSFQVDLSHRSKYAQLRQVAGSVHSRCFRGSETTETIMIARKLISASECREISKLRVTPESQTIQK
jgi:hypothetical protein